MKANQAFKQADEAVSPVIGVILMVAITVVLAAVVFVLVTKLSSNNKDKAPEVQFSKDDDVDNSGGGATYTLIGASSNAGDWASFEVLGPAPACTWPTSGTLTAGDTIVCEDDLNEGDVLRLRHIPTNTIIFQATI